MKFNFGPGKAPPGCSQVLPDMVYEKERGFGFENGAVVQAADGGAKGGVIFSDKPFLFSVAVPEGNSQVAPREQSSKAKARDDKLTLECDDIRPGVGAIEIKRVDDLPVLFICGDSTVGDQPGENNASRGRCSRVSPMCLTLAPACNPARCSQF